MKTRIILIILVFISLSSISQIKVACIGNSITYGAYIENRETMAYPQQLNEILGDEWEVVNFGSNGATMLKEGNNPYWDLPIYKQAKYFMPDVVIILLGTNDSKPQNWKKNGDEFKNDYLDMIEEFQSLDSRPIIFLGLPVQVVKDRWGITKQIVEQDITEIVKQIAKNKKTDLIDFNKSLRDKNDLFPDKIHPNAEGAHLMAKEAAQVLLNKQEIISTR